MWSHWTWLILCCEFFKDFDDMSQILQKIWVVFWCAGDSETSEPKEFHLVQCLNSLNKLGMEFLNRKTAKMTHNLNQCDRNKNLCYEFNYVQLNLRIRKWSEETRRWNQMKWIRKCTKNIRIIIDFAGLQGVDQ